MRRVWLILVLWIFAGFCASVFGASGGYLFKSDEPVDLRIEAPLKSLKKQRGDDPEWLDAKAFIKDEKGLERVLDIRIKARGNFRRQTSTCSFPSYWLDFKKKQVKGTIFKGQNKLKVVAHCREGRKSFAPYIYKEYLAYKTYNQITDESFRVRLARIDYQDTESKYKREGQVAFFIEHVDTFAKRLKAIQMKDQYVLPSLYDQKRLARADMFQYMMANTDYTFFASTDNCCHNGKVFAFSDPEQDLLPVPYDFDLSGIVNAPYAAVNTKLKIMSVRERLYRGLMVDDAILTETIVLFQAKQAAIYELWEGFQPLDELHRQRALDFMNTFYEVINDPGKVEVELRSSMRDVDRIEKIITKKIDGEK